MDELTEKDGDRVAESVAHALRVVGPPEDSYETEESPAAAD